MPVPIAITNIFETYEELFGKYETVDAYLKAQAADKNSEYAKLKAEAANPTYIWTQDKLLYAIDDTIVNRQSGSTDSSDKVANIIGKDITLRAKNIGGVLQDKTITVEQITGKDGSNISKKLLR